MRRYILQCNATHRTWGEETARRRRSGWMRMRGRLFEKLDNKPCPRLPAPARTVPQIQQCDGSLEKATCIDDAERVYPTGWICCVVAGWQASFFFQLHVSTKCHWMVIIWSEGRGVRDFGKEACWFRHVVRLWGFGKGNWWGETGLCRFVHVA
jgi:hypothetical protein